jgi:hypothetical protein
MGHSTRPVAPPSPGWSLARLRCTSSLAEKEEAGALFEGLRDFFRVFGAHRPEKSLRALMDPLADALCGAPKWLKSSVERLSEKGVSDALSVDLAGIRRPKWAEKHCLGCP